MSTTHQHADVREAVRDGIARTLAVVGLAGMALIHLLFEKSASKKRNSTGTE